MKPGTYISDMYPEPRFFWPALAIGVLGVWIGFHFEIDWYWCVLIGSFAFFFGMIIHWRAVIESADGIVREEARLGGGKLICERRHALKDFGAIVFDLFGAETEGWRVGIRHHSGRTIWLRFFHGDPRQETPVRAAEEFAWRLSCDTGWEIEEYKPKSRR